MFAKALMMGSSQGGVPLIVEFVVVSGGGSGKDMTSSSTPRVLGGGGAGGYEASVSGEVSGGNTPALSPWSPTKGVAYTITVGAGASAAVNERGGRSQLHSVGYPNGGGWGGYLPLSGGSGGGGGLINTNVYSGASGVSGEGFEGGDAVYTTNQYLAGGGGGAGQAGQDGQLSSKAGDGGDGITTNIKGTPLTLAGGGGGGAYGSSLPAGAGGAGGGGLGRNSVFLPSVDGTVNTGGGGGGLGGIPGATYYGGNGGSGRVLFKVLSIFDAGISFTAGVVYTTTTVGDYTVYDVTAAGSTDTVTFN